jgi:hypothetical protein
MTDQVVVIERDALVWGFQSDGPVVRIGSGRYKRHESVDPTPAYPHDPTLVRAVLAQVQAAWPLPERERPSIYLLPNETTTRTNGWTAYDHDYDGEKDEDGSYPWLAWIALSAKRIPIHPAMTRYLVAHEYGHVVERALKAVTGIKETEELQEYRDLRGLTDDLPYGAGTWHASPSEVFANDFRLTITGIEAEFWPHAGIARPDAKVRDWFRREQRAAKKRAAA